MEEDTQSIPDLSDLTCTNLMIRIKMLLKNAGSQQVVECIVRRDQRDTIDVPFSRSGYEVRIRKVDRNLYRVSLKLKSAGRGN